MADEPPEQAEGSTPKTPKRADSKLHFWAAPLKRRTRHYYATWQEEKKEYALLLHLAKAYVDSEEAEALRLSKPVVTRSHSKLSTSSSASSRRSSGKYIEADLVLRAKSSLSGGATQEGATKEGGHDAVSSAVDVGSVRTSLGDADEPSSPAGGSGSVGLGRMNRWQASRLKMRALSVMTTEQAGTLPQGPVAQRLKRPTSPASILRVCRASVQKASGKKPIRMHDRMSIRLRADVAAYQAQKGMRHSSDASEGGSVHGSDRRPSGTQVGDAISAAAASATLTSRPEGGDVGNKDASNNVDGGGTGIDKERSPNPVLGRVTEAQGRMPTVSGAPSETNATTAPIASLASLLPALRESSNGSTTTFTCQDLPLRDPASPALSSTPSGQCSQSSLKSSSSGHPRSSSKEAHYASAPSSAPSSAEPPPFAAGASGGRSEGASASLRSDPSSWRTEATSWRTDGPSSSLRSDELAPSPLALLRLPQPICSNSSACGSAGNSRRSSDPFAGFEGSTTSSPALSTASRGKAAGAVSQSPKALLRAALRRPSGPFGKLNEGRRSGEVELRSERRSSDPLVIEAQQQRRSGEERERRYSDPFAMYDGSGASSPWSSALNSLEPSPMAARPPLFARRRAHGASPRAPPKVRSGSSQAKLSRPPRPASMGRPRDSPACMREGSTSATVPENDTV